ncbi:MAG: ABC transporter ATP-binding protein [Planctomycetota bacterium]
MAEQALELTDLRYGYPGGPLVIEVASYGLGAGEQALMVGSSGSGKSTLLQLIAGLLDADAGAVFVGGTDLGSLRGASRDRCRGRSVGMVFQTLNLLVGFSAVENVLAALMFGQKPAAEHRARAEGLLGRLGVERIDARVESLSVGQQQRVAVARALACGPALVLADEPTASLDPENAAVAVELLKEVCQEEGASLLMVSHDPAMRERFGRVDELASINRASEPAGIGGQVQA